MGCGASNITGRVAASLGNLIAVAPQFQSSLDIPNGGVLCALPALLALGLLDTQNTQDTQDTQASSGTQGAQPNQAGALNPLPNGYYGTDSLLILLTFLALCRIDSIEAVRYTAPGEWGKLLGLDRIPEVRTLRTKIAQLSAHGAAARFSAQLSQHWMQSTPEQAGTLYVDGHTRVYHGSQTKLPRHYIARQKLCLRATVDFWVNAANGQPFFAINKVVDPGLCKVLEEDIVPRLLNDVPNQPTAAQLAAKPLLHRFTLVFDREGYSPALFSRLKALRVACLSYHKYPEEDWDVSEFSPTVLTLTDGNITTLRLAERGSKLSNGLWVRQVRKLSPSGHQTAIISTDYQRDLRALAAHMFARWSQENFFKYMRQQYGLDHLSSYATELITEPILVTNPAHRELARQLSSATAKLQRALAGLGAISLSAALECQQMGQYMLEQAALREEIEAIQERITVLKATRKATASHIEVNDLPSAQRFTKLSTQTKPLMDAIKMLAYRAETAMAHCLREQLTRPDEARRLLQALYQTEADLIVDEANMTLTVRLHHCPQRVSDQAIGVLCNELNETKTVFPRSNLVMRFELI